jgi:hypothetical protein
MRRIRGRAAMKAILYQTLLACASAGYSAGGVSPGPEWLIYRAEMNPDDPEFSGRAHDTAIGAGESFWLEEWWKIIEAEFPGAWPSPQ